MKLAKDWKRLWDDKKKIVGVLTTDLSKAFDSLHYYIIHSPPLLLANWLRAYGFSDAVIGLPDSVQDQFSPYTYPYTVKR